MTDNIAAIEPTTSGMTRKSEESVRRYPDYAQACVAAWTRNIELTSPLPESRVIQQEAQQ